MEYFPGIMRDFKRLSDAVGKQKEAVLKEMFSASDQSVSALFYLLNPLMSYGIGEKSLRKETGKPVTKEYYSFFSMMDDLNAMSGVSDQVLRNVQNFISEHQEYREIIEGILTKSITLGVTAKTVNKAAEYEFIPEFSVMLANKYFEHQSAVEGKSFTITEKFDGIRCAGIVADGIVKLYTRQGQRIEGLVDIERDLLMIYERCHQKDIVFDGELLISDRDQYPSKEQYKRTTKIVRSDGEKHGVTYNVFDVVEYDGFLEKKCIMPYYLRRQRLTTYLQDGYANVHLVPTLYSGSDVTAIRKYLDAERAKQHEGIMINLNDAVYEYKRTNALLKCKVMQDCDLKITGVQQGSGKFADTLGSLVVDYKGNPVGVGSGLSDEIRRDIWQHPDDYIGRVATIQYFEVTADSNGVESLRFPVFKEIREMGKEVSYS